MDDPARVLIVISGCAAAAYSVKVIASAMLQYQLNELKNPNRAPPEDRLARIEHAVDAIAVEVERISEGQRFTTRLLSERTEKR